MVFQKDVYLEMHDNFEKTAGEKGKKNQLIYFTIKLPQLIPCFTLQQLFCLTSFLKCHV